MLSFDHQQQEDQRMVMFLLRQQNLYQQQQAQLLGVPVLNANNHPPVGLPVPRPAGFVGNSMLLGFPHQLEVPRGFTHFPSSMPPQTTPLSLVGAARSLFQHTYAQGSFTNNTSSVGPICQNLETKCLLQQQIIQQELEKSRQQHQQHTMQTIVSQLGLVDPTSAPPSRLSVSLDQPTPKPPVQQVSEDESYHHDESKRISTTVKIYDQQQGGKKKDSTRAAAPATRARPIKAAASSKAKPKKKKHELKSPKSPLHSSSLGGGGKKWLANFEQLQAYKNTHGNCLIPRGFAQNPRLASWVADQRKHFKLFKDGKPSNMTKERASFLDKLGFVWNVQSDAWHAQLKDLQDYKIKTGHTQVPLHCAAYPHLGLWIKEQRRHYNLRKQGKASHMTDYRISALEKIDGFCWDNTHDTLFYERLQELQDFKQEYGHTEVPPNWIENPRLATWVIYQRRQYKLYTMGKKPCHITKERIQALDKLQFQWHCKKQPRRKSSSSSSVPDEEETIDEVHL